MIQWEKEEARIVAAVNDSNMERIEWIDILKGLGILSVVWGHTGSKNAFYMFWFHMPLFFFVSGYLYQFKPQQTALAYLKKKARHLLVPYLFYLCFITLAMILKCMWQNQSVGAFITDNWRALLLGGSLLEGVYATFWFTTCLFSVQVVYDYLVRKIALSFFRWIIIVACFFLAYWESRHWADSFIPWNMDVGLYALIFYALGHVFKKHQLLKKPTYRNFVFGLSALIFGGFIYLYSHQILDYGLDMKHRQYYYLGTNLILPLVLIMFLIQLSMIFSKWSLTKNTCSGVGRAAMVIMYLHLGSVYLVRQFVAMTPVRFFIVGILVPLLFYELAKRVPYGKSIALGEPEARFLPDVPKISTKSGSASITP